MWSVVTKNGNFRNRFFDILTIHNDQISYVKHVLDPLYVFHPIQVFGEGGGGRGLPRGLGHHLLMQFSTLGSSKGACGTIDEDFLVLTCACSL